MSIRYFPERRNGTWVVSWRNPWTGKKHKKGFETEAVAQAFEKAQAEIAARERALLRKARKKKAEKNRITVRELVESYFAMVYTNSQTRKVTQYHIVHILAAFGARQAALISHQVYSIFQQRSGCEEYHN